jgi:hypothetical protein
MKVTGLILDAEKKIKYFMVKYHYNTAVHSVSEMIKRMDYYEIKGVEMGNGVLTVTQKFPKFQIEGLDKVEAIMHTLEHNKELKKKLAGIDEESVRLSVSNDSICVIKSFRDDEFFTDYDYDSNGYNDAQFIGFDTIPDIVAPYLNGISKERISCGGGEKLWYSVEVYCNEFAKLVSLS